MDDERFYLAVSFQDNQIEYYSSFLAIISGNDKMRRFFARSFSGLRCDDSESVRYRLK